MKRCSGCKQWKERTEFHKNKTRADGLQHECKECKRIRQCNHDRTDILKRYSSSIKGRATRRRYELTTKGKKATKKYRTSKKGRENARQYVAEYRKKYPKRERANRLITNAIRSGRMPSATTLKCQYCDDMAFAYHHPDYDHPFDVIRVCPKHHIQVHKEKNQ